MTSLSAEPSVQARVDFRVAPASYRHWRLTVAGPVATLSMDVDEQAGLRPGYELKLNSYDLGVDIELYDAVQRLRFEHPEVRAVVLTSGKDRIFCAGANIRMLAGAEHGWKVNFCKFTNETRNGIEDATEHSGQRYLAALNGSASGGGYELALACGHLMLIDDRSAVVSLPELPLLGVLPGTGGLTRLVDKRRVRRDLADHFATRADGVGGARAVSWRLVDEAVPPARWQQAVADRAAALAERSDRPADATGIELSPLTKQRTDHRVDYRYLSATLEPASRQVAITITGPATDPPVDPAAIHALGADFWPLAITRELDDLILDLRTNEPELGSWVFRTRGRPDRVLAYDTLLARHAEHWLVREILLYLKRTLKRLEVTSRSLIALIEPGSCYAGSLAELVLAADRSFQLLGTFTDLADSAEDSAVDSADSADEPAALTLGELNFGPLPMANGLTRLQTRFLADEPALAAVQARAGEPLLAEQAAELGLVTFTPDDLDWDDEVRIAIEERASFSPDALTGLEASLRFAGPETIETKIFGRLSAWQNWVFYRPNASGPDGALRRFGTGQRPDFDRKRV